MEHVRLGPLPAPNGGMLNFRFGWQADIRPSLVDDLWVLEAVIKLGGKIER
jgi:hypothetical protein